MRFERNAATSADDPSGHILMPAVGSPVAAGKRTSKKVGTYVASPGPNVHAHLIIVTAMMILVARPSYRHYPAQARVIQKPRRVYRV